MSEPIRVLQIVTTMNRGGLETMLINYYRSIDRDKVQFDFLVHRNEKSDYEDEILDLGGKIYRVPALNPFSLNYRKELKKFFSKHTEYSIVHCHLDCMSSIPLYYAKKLGVKTRIAHSHSSSQDKDLKYFLKLFYKSKITGVATHLFACGKKAGRWMFNTDNFKVINNAIKIDDFLFNKEISMMIRNDLKLNDKFIIGHVGRFNEPKNHTFIIDIFKELYKMNNNSHLVLVGEGNLRNEIEKKVCELQLDNNVIFYGLCSNVNDIMQAFDVFLFPSLYEGLPVTMVEAQASGLKCFISDRIPKECILTDNVKSISLETSPQIWAKEIAAYSFGYERQNTLKEIINGGFDIENNSKELEKFYLNECNK